MVGDKESEKKAMEVFIVKNVHGDDGREKRFCEGQDKFEGRV